MPASVGPASEGMGQGADPQRDSASTTDVSATPSTRTAPARRVPPGRPLLILLIASALAVFFLVTLGGVVRVTESGLGCPDWPLCHGRLIPPLDFNTLIEYSHRLAASLTSTLIVATTALAWWRYRHQPRIVWPVTTALALLGVEVVLGGVTVLTELPPTIVTIHLATAEIIFALLLVALVGAWQQPRFQAPASPQVYQWAVAAALATLVVLLSGSYAVGRGAGTICPGWPFCQSDLFPSLELTWVHMAHRLLAAGGGLLAAWAALVAWRRRGSSAGIGVVAVVAGGVLIAQTMVGAANPWTGFSTFARAAHLSLATAMWGSYVVLATLAWRPRSASETGSSRTLWDTAADYLTLTKPLIIVLLLITALGAMFLAAEGVPPLGTALLVMVGGALGAGGANALNHYLDQDIDERMYRTRNRPLPGDRIRPRNALVFGILLNVVAFIVLAVGVNLLAALLTAGATLFYVLVYTLWLKRSTTQNIVIGGAAGAVPPLVGWAAITGGVGLPALYMFAIVFFWTPPHFWALSLLIRSDYARAGVPMLPVVSGVEATTRSILLHSLILVTITILFATVASVGWIYLSGATGLGTVFLYLAWRLFRSESTRAARHLYLFSLSYLMLLFALIMVEAAS